MAVFLPSLFTAKLETHAISKNVMLIYRVLSSQLSCPALNIKMLQMALALSLDIHLDMYTWKHTGQDIHYFASGQGQE